MYKQGLLSQRRWQGSAIQPCLLESLYETNLSDVHWKHLVPVKKSGVGSYSAKQNENVEERVIDGYKKDFPPMSYL